MGEEGVKGNNHPINFNMKKIALHGFGRIGRQFLRVGLTQDLFVPASVSDIKDEATLAALFAVDTIYGRWHEPVSGKDGNINIGGREIIYNKTSQKIPHCGALYVVLI